MKERRVLLDASFLRALAEPHDPVRVESRAAFDTLLDEVLCGSTSLYTHSDAIAAAGGEHVAELTRVCEVVQVRRWVHRAAGRVVAANPDPALRWDHAVTLAVADHFGVGEVIAVDPFFAERGVATTSGEARPPGARGGTATL